MSRPKGASAIAFRADAAIGVVLAQPLIGHQDRLGALDFRNAAQLPSSLRRGSGRSALAKAPCAGTDWSQPSGGIGAIQHGPGDDG